MVVEPCVGDGLSDLPSASHGVTGGCLSGVQTRSSGGEYFSFGSRREQSIRARERSFLPRRAALGVGALLRRALADAAPAPVASLLQPLWRPPLHLAAVDDDAVADHGNQMKRKGTELVIGEGGIDLGEIICQCEAKGVWIWYLEGLEILVTSRMSRPRRACWSSELRRRMQASHKQRRRGTCGGCELGRRRAACGRHELAAAPHMQKPRATPPRRPIAPQPRLATPLGPASRASLGRAAPLL